MNLTILRSNDEIRHCNVKVELADTWRKRLIGLLAKSGVSDQYGMLFRPGESIHTIGMRFPIDVLFLDKDNRVLKISHDMKSFRLSFAPKGTYSVLEINGGNAKRTGIHLEDTLRFV